MFDLFSSDIWLLYILCPGMMCMENWFDGLLMANGKWHKLWPLKSNETEENNCTLMWCNFFCFLISILIQMTMVCVFGTCIVSQNRSIVYGQMQSKFSKPTMHRHARNNNGLAMFLSVLVHHRKQNIPSNKIHQGETREEFKIKRYRT